MLMVRHQNWSQTKPTIHWPKQVMWPNSESKRREITSSESDHNTPCVDIEMRLN